MLEHDGHAAHPCQGWVRRQLASRVLAYALVSSAFLAGVAYVPVLLDGARGGGDLNILALFVVAVLVIMVVIYHSLPASTEVGDRYGVVNPDYPYLPLHIAQRAAQAQDVAKQLASRAQLPRPHVWVDPREPAINAAILRTREGGISIILTQGVLNFAQDHELYAAVAHELGHIVTWKPLDAPRFAEYRADHWAAQQVGFRSMIDLLRHVHVHAEREAQGSHTAGLLQQFWYPSTQKRVERLMAHARHELAPH